ncbi:MAG: ParB/RepB/Spo0J family partition protein [Fibrobacter sp.]|nr:ParB/RepB/Spo0J family partition protein [Clostridia bacterium]MBR4680708.1 ParB/RepB/Spo0J family partition protein [Fibrobacter sp.]
MVQEIFQIPVDLIDPHPMNPRKDLGDLTELVASIKRSGIMQNLTVVHSTKAPNRFTCLIGHRRLAAAKLAGFATVPASIAEGMSEKDQIATMVAENMQRNDLTITEQAGAVQLMLDFGDDFSTIAERTGLSESTVRRRAKLSQYDPKAIDKALRRGASLLDIEKIDQIEDTEKREQLLKAAGTNNFNNLFRSFKDEQERIRIAEEITTILEKNGFRPLSELPPTEAKSYDQSIWNLKEYKDHPAIKNPEEYRKSLPEDAILYYLRHDDSWNCRIELYHTSESGNKVANEKRLFEESVNSWKSRIRRINNRFHELRMKHIKSVFSRGKRDRSFFQSIVADHVVRLTKGNGVRYSVEQKYNTIVKKAQKEIKPEMELYLLVALNLEADAEDGCFNEYSERFDNRDSITKIYQLLIEDGYQRSDEEIEYYNGTHRIFSQNPRNKEGKHA